MSVIKRESMLNDDGCDGVGTWCCPISPSDFYMRITSTAVKQKMNIFKSQVRNLDLAFSFPRSIFLRIQVKVLKN